MVLFTIFVVLAVVMSAIYVLHNYRGRKQSVGLASSLAAVDGQNRPDFNKLIGNWIRPDGGYVISIRDINSDGQVQAAYYNPNPINVAQSKTTFKGNKIKLFIELRDAGYPGCTYDLSYEPKTDQLSGVYYQAAIQERYDIVFLRK